MSNPVASLIVLAVERGWCTQPNGGACEPAEFRDGLRVLAGADGTRLVEALRTLDLAAWYDLPAWDGAIRLALDALPRAAERTTVVEAWLGRLDGHLRIADVVLFYVVRRGSVAAPLAERWYAASLRLALASEDPSLLESVVYAAGDRGGEALEAEAVVVARRVARRNARLRKALDRTLPYAPGA